MEDVYKNSSIHGFCVNRPSESRMLLTGVIAFLSYFTHLLSNLRDLHLMPLCDCELCGNGGGRPHFSYGRKLSRSYACDVKLYEIWKVKNALAKPVYCLTEHTICRIVSLLLQLSAQTADSKPIMRLIV
jgi:hypothetical protein